MKRTVPPNGIGLHSALLWSERQRLSVALVASIVTHGFALALTPILQPEPQTLPEVLQVELVALAAPASVSQSEPNLAPLDGARGPTPDEPDAAPPEPAPPPPPEPAIEVEPPKPRPARVEKKPKPPSKPPERVELPTPSPAPQQPPAEAVVAQREPIAETSPVPSPQVEQGAPPPEGPVETARAEPQLALAMPSREAALDAYRKAVSRLIVRDRNYPPIARARHWEGTVEVQVRIGPGEKVHEPTIGRSSGFKVLDAEALEMVRKALEMVRNAQPFPPVPKALGEVVVTVPISFELRD